MPRFPRRNSPRVEVARVLHLNFARMAANLLLFKVGQTLVAIELDGGQMVPLTTETPFAP